MKKLTHINLLSFVALMLIATVLITSCKKSDKTAPVITLTGNASIDNILNIAYTEQGATASDDTDGDLTSSITVTGSVNKDLTGTYSLVYSVSDEAGNSSSVTRTVRVYNQAENLAGVYNSTLTFPWPSGATSSPTRTVTASTTTNKDLYITGFGQSTTSNVRLVVNLTQDTIHVPNQTGTGGYSFKRYDGIPNNCTFNDTGTPIVMTLYAKQTISSVVTGYEEVMQKQ